MFPLPFQEQAMASPDNVSLAACRNCPPDRLKFRPSDRHEPIGTGFSGKSCALLLNSSRLYLFILFATYPVHSMLLTGEKEGPPVSGGSQSTSCGTN